MVASHMMNQLQLVLILVFCWPTAAFSTSSQVPLISQHGGNMRSRPIPSQLHLRIPRGGDQSETTQSTKSSSSLGILSPMAAVFQSAGSSYSAALVARPILTKSLTAGLTFFLSDYCAQRIEKPSVEEEKEETPAWKHNWTRTLVSCAVGLFYFGPAAHAWYEWIFSILPGTSLASTLQKAVLGQCLFGPSFTCIFFATSLMQAGTFTIPNWIRKIKSDLPQAFISGAGFWPLVDLISYSYIPVKYIPLFINLCSFAWTIYLSMIANKE